MRMSNMRARISDEWFRITAKAALGKPGARVAEIVIDGDIGRKDWDDSGENTTSPGFRKALAAVGHVDEIDLRINSLGGDVWQGVAIHNLIRTHPATVIATIEGVAASIGSLIAMAADKIRIPANAQIMIHLPRGGEFGNADAMRSMAVRLEQVTESMISTYTARSGQTREAVAEMMAAETWLTADEAVRLGFADEIAEPVRMVAMDMSRYASTPEPLLLEMRKPDRSPRMNIVPITPELLAAVKLGVAANPDAGKMPDVLAAHVQGDPTETGSITRDELFAFAESLGVDPVAAVTGAIGNLGQPQAAAKATAPPALAAVPVTADDFRANARAVADLCAIARRPEQAGNMIASGLTPDQARARLLQAAADDSGEEIVSAHSLPAAEPHKEPGIVTNAKKQRAAYERQHPAA